MLSEATARLVEHTATLRDTEWVPIKGADQPVPVRQLLAVGPRRVVERAEASLVGRKWEMAFLDAMVGRALDGRGGVVNVAGPAGIGKSRAAREAAALAAARGVEVFWAFCESHAGDIPFNVAAQILRATREQLRTGVADTDPQDLLLLDDLLGIAVPDAELAQIEPDARRRRLTALVNAATLARTTPALFIVEDAHWIDAVSESMLADFIAVVPRTPTMVMITSRPEYEGTLTRVHGAQAITLTSLADSDISALLGQLLGGDPSVSELAAVIAERADGNPFFAEEMVRELVQRGVLTGRHGNRMCHTSAADVAVPATVQAAIAARIDRLSASAAKTLTAASVIGARFEEDLLATLQIDAAFDELLAAELIDQVRFSPAAEYAFRHPLIRAVAYESQLKSDRAEWHRRLAAAIEERDPDSVDDNAALIAEHVEAAGDLHAAYGWHMRAGMASASRNVDAARVGWERACRIADALPAEDPARLPMRIAPRTMLCATDWQAKAVQESQGRFEELRELCNAADDKVSLAIGMTGLATELLFTSRPNEGAPLVSEQMALLESIGDPDLTIGLAFQALATWFDVGEFNEIMRWSQTVIDLADGDPVKGAAFGVGSPLAMALALRSIARCWLGLPGWRDDADDAVEMARSSDPTTLALVFAWAYGVGIVCNVLPVDDPIVQTIEDAVAGARRASSDTALIFAEYGLGGSLLYRDDAVDRARGRELLLRIRGTFCERVPSLVPVIDIAVPASQIATNPEESDAAISAIRATVDGLRQAERLRGGYGIWAASTLAEVLLERGGEHDLMEAQEAIDGLAALAEEKRWAMLDIIVLRLRALLARARGDDIEYKDLASRYLEMAKSHDFEGHIALAEAMIE
jgi:hypothetical protein